MLPGAMAAAELDEAERQPLLGAARPTGPRDGDPDPDPDELAGTRLPGRGANVRACAFVGVFVGALVVVLLHTGATQKEPMDSERAAWRRLSGAEQRR